MNGEENGQISKKLNVREYRRDNQKRIIQRNWYTRQRKTKQKHNTICVGQHYTQTTTNNVNLHVEYILKTFEKFSKSNTSNLCKEVIFCLYIF